MFGGFDCIFVFFLFYLFEILNKIIGRRVSRRRRRKIDIIKVIRNELYAGRQAVRQPIEARRYLGRWSWWFLLGKYRVPCLGWSFSLGAHVLGEVPTIRSVIEFVVYPYLLCYLLCVYLCSYLWCVGRRSLRWWLHYFLWLRFHLIPKAKTRATLHLYHRS